MEFLMTYGWAILIMLVVIAVLFYLGVFNSSTSVPSSCVLPAGFTCAEFSLDSSGRLYLDLGQATGKTITVNGVGCSASGASVTALSIPVTVQTGSHAVVSDSDITCSGNYSGAFKGKVSIRYQPSGAAYNKTITGDLSAPVAVVAAGEQGQWNTSYAYYRQVTVNTGVSSNLTDFPAYFILDTQHLIAYGRMNSTCKDLRVVNSTKDGVMDYEIENNTCNTTNTVVWFRVPQTNAANDYTAYVFYGNSSASDAQNRAGVWSNGYKGVYHLGDFMDSITGAYGTNSSMVLNSTARFGAGMASAASNSRIAFTDPILGASYATICAWTWKYTYRQYAGVVSDYVGNDGQRNFILGYETPQDNLIIYFGDGNATASPGKSGWTLGTWHYVCGTFNGSNREVAAWVDAVKGGPTTASFSVIGNNQSTYSQIGRYSGSYSLNGTIDELRLSNVTRTADWISAEYGQTYSVGSEQVN